MDPSGHKVTTARSKKIETGAKKIASKYGRGLNFKSVDYSDNSNYKLVVNFGSSRINKIVATGGEKCKVVLTSNHDSAYRITKEALKKNYENASNDVTLAFQIFNVMNYAENNKFTNDYSIAGATKEHKWHIRRNLIDGDTRKHTFATDIELNYEKGDRKDYYLVSLSQFNKEVDWYYGKN